MEVRDMVRMANQIADFFKAYPEEQAVAEIANHLRSFWEPNMRTHLHGYVAKGGAGLDPLVIRAAASLRAAA